MQEVSAVNSVHNYNTLRLFRLIAGGFVSDKFREMLKPKNIKPDWLNYSLLDAEPGILKSKYGINSTMDKSLASI